MATEMFSKLQAVSRASIQMPRFDTNSVEGLDCSDLRMVGDLIVGLKPHDAMFVDLRI